MTCSSWPCRRASRRRRPAEEQLHAATRTMSTGPDMPAGLRALGRVLNQVLAGDRDPDLSALLVELADRMRALLTALERAG